MAKPCDSCNTAPAAVFCRLHSAFLCPTCDADLHAPPTRHPRVGLCDVCEQSPAAVTCKADAAALCSACDADIHAANPLARRHHRLPVLPFYHAAAAAEDFSEEEAEAASWILPDPNSKPDLDSGSPRGANPGRAERKQVSTDGVVPGEDNSEYESGQYPGRVADGFPAYDLEYSGSKPFIMYNFTTSQSISQSVSSPSFEVGVVPDDNAMADTSKNVVVPCRALGVDREARVLRYKEKRKNRMFKKTIRYASRKAYAETRPRIKGRFAKRSELEASNYGVVPSF